ncbi:hypothetical protein PVAP13_3KG264857 [Panicum virgatum]|uniref:Uncharacterized protein n=1 Tax=Panicum virgatum TaxID=38727 RepID=A0A8T0UYD1_PANVG|nr:hypothetical protein PVAP13_3KG264857 [Panicum virgatum]
MSSRGFGLTKAVLAAAVGAFGGWKCRDKYEEMVGAVKPTSIVARLSRLWDGGGGAEDRRLRQLEEKVRESERLVAESRGDQRKLLAIVEDIQRRLNGRATDSYQHECPPLPPPPPQQPRRP